MLISFWIAFLAIALVLGVYRTSFCYCALIISRILIPECVRLTPIIDNGLYL